MTQRYARLAGAFYFLILATSLLSMILVQSRLVVEHDPLTTLQRIGAHPVLYRAGLLYDVTMFASVLLLAWSLFVVLRKVHAPLAMLALLWRSAEAIVGAAAVLIGLFVAQLPADPAHAQLAQWLLNLRGNAFDIVLIFLSLGTLVNVWLFHRGNLVPRFWIVLGVISFVLMLFTSAYNLLSPVHATWTMVAFGPGMLFELGFGLWLAFRGVSQHTEKESQLELANAH